MATIPVFPKFKKIEIDDKDIITDFFLKYPSDISELTFTNIFIWRKHYGTKWSVYKNWLFLIFNTISSSGGLMPVGPAPRVEPTRVLLDYLKESGEKNPSIQRADKRFAEEIKNPSLFVIEPSREYFDYVYLSKNLIELPGRKYHSKRNHIKKFQESYSFSFERFKEEYTRECEEIADKWCKTNRCEDDLDLLGERCAINEILLHFPKLNIFGGVIRINNRVEAFTFGENLNKDTGVVHIEKANPDIPGLYQVINQKFAEDAFSSLEFINREEDLGMEGLRKAKGSYHPSFFIEKFKINSVV
ncbi:MAG: phosphatidylglycerol lysyltransferase domain-containing protein [Candidatus Omnitrophica bacterium]|nr:phosphatidylglycerol lysyltransferase domain-containing protein [Candidatus Omnitrophota bacterium]